MNSQASITQCPVGCRSELLPAGLVVMGVAIRKCSECGHLVGTTSEQTHSAANLVWDNEQGTWPDPKSMRRLEKRRVRTLRTAARILGRPLAGLSLLDVGCSNGTLLDIAGRHGLVAEGVEPAQNAAADGVRRGFKVHEGAVEQLPLQPESYDLITSFEVIEHIQDPTPMLLASLNLLRPGGVLVIGTGNTASWSFAALGADWDFMHPSAGHINYFSSTSLAKLAASLGFDVARVWTGAVTLCNRDQAHPFVYSLWKLCGQALSLPANLMGKGHQLEMFLTKRSAKK